MDYSFYATISRMKYIDRWALMRNTREENLSEHSLEVAMIAHALCVIGNTRYGKQLDAEHAAMIGIYHDASEIITGDMPTPIKYYNQDIKAAFKDIETEANKKLLAKLPEDLQAAYEDIFFKEDAHAYEWRLVKAADKLSALIKCMEEMQINEKEFAIAYQSTLEKVNEMAEDYPEIRVYMEEFLPSYGEALDTLLDDGTE